MWVTRGLLVLGLLCAAPAWSASKAELETRVQQLEHKLDSRGLVEMFDRVSTLQKEVQQLRGELEVQSHDMENLKKRQRDLYADTDRRLHRLETSGVQSGVPPAPVAATTITSPGTTRPPADGGVLKAPPTPETGKVDAASLPALDPAAERKDYDNALAILNELRYDEAAAAFRTFLKNYPGSGYADNAQYWLGEVYYVTRKFTAALAEFGALLKGFPNSPKVPGAMLKMGYSHYELKDWKAAADMLEQVVKRFPGTSTDRLAQERLSRMKREGRLPTK
ncbi:TPR repeat containing exported protein; Putative periplasmic protein contains a protein prenylyltransferase domain [hydrothermal vent metagenome]|uniref:TPR repeat containing exported protein Putative periplasmic protein contains a protein prenylyltransferase domain n=1 Tax=hydrothermal vent metagenome TaxID=652676 RepID=A0A3B0Z826_9ZZZZ